MSPDCFTDPSLDVDMATRLSNNSCIKYKLEYSRANDVKIFEVANKLSDHGVDFYVNLPDMPLLLDAFV